MNPPSPNSYRKGTWLFGAILLTASVSGFFMGLKQTGSQISMSRPISLVAPDQQRQALLATNAVPEAVPYWSQDWLQHGANAGWRSAITQLTPPPAQPGVLTNVTDGERAAALQERAARRAFDGAPPVVPHPIAQESSAACLACHGPGLAVKDKVASKISHAFYANCTQCHVPATGLEIPTLADASTEVFALNAFVAAAPRLRGTRAWPQAPPTIPHSTFMRSDCLSCHGAGGLFGLRTPHPDRQACVQCHAPDADLDQHHFPPAAAGDRLDGTKWGSRVAATSPTTP